MREETEVSILNFKLQSSILSHMWFFAWTFSGQTYLGGAALVTLNYVASLV